MIFLNHPEKALFLDRPNRFTMICRLNGKIVKAYLPNPGRMWELLLPGVSVYLEKSLLAGEKMPYTVVAVERENQPVMVHTHKTNDVVNSLLNEKMIPGLESAAVVRREVTIGHSRFDFLLKDGKREIILEVKSCTLFGDQVAMFPDAVTARGKRHMEELASLTQGNTTGAVIFLIGWPQARYFMPEYHTDLEFSRTLLAVRNKIQILPLGLQFLPDLSFASNVRILEIPWDLVQKEAKDEGSYLVILHLPGKTKIEVGNLGRIQFDPGHYIYVGSARKNLFQRMQRHRRLVKSFFWHIDYLRAKAEFVASLAIRTQDDLECAVAQAMKKIAGWEIRGFGSSDCSCPSHLFGMAQDPLRSPQFISLLQHFRMDRLLE
jgi:sugar fermentation stimulation protein A